MSFVTQEKDYQLCLRILKETKEKLLNRCGYSVCHIEDVRDKEHTDILTYLHRLTRTTYMMARVQVTKPTQFVHFTSERAAISIVENNFNFDNENPNGDFYRAICCFREDTTSRSFITEKITHAVLFNYTGEYFTCIRQEDSNSNIGYQIIEDLTGISDRRVISLEDYNIMHSFVDIDYTQLLLHHGLPSCFLNRIEGTPYSKLSTVVPRLYGNIINSAK